MEASPGEFVSNDLSPPGSFVMSLETHQQHLSVIDQIDHHLIICEGGPGMKFLIPEILSGGWIGGGIRCFLQGESVFSATSSMPKMMMGMHSNSLSGVFKE